MAVLKTVILEEMAGFLLAVFIDYIMIFETDKFPQKVAFQGPTQFSIKETEVLPFVPCIINMLMLGF